MSIRHEARERAVQFLFQMDFNQNEDVAKELNDFWEHHEVKSSKIISFAEQIVYGVKKNQEQIETTICSCADNWDMERMGAVDRNVLRLAAFEMLFCDDIPPVVSINEAVDIAKDLSNAESGRFVNGILDKLLTKIKRPARTAAKSGKDSKKNG